MYRKVKLFLFFLFLVVFSVIFNAKGENLIDYENLNYKYLKSYLNLGNLEYDWNKIIEDKKKEFDRSWNNFLDTNFFGYNLENSKYYNLAVIYKYGLKDEDINIVGIRYFLFYLIKKIIKEELSREGIYFKDELIINEDYIGFNYILLNLEDIKKVYTVLNGYKRIYGVNKDIYNLNGLNLDELKGEVEREIERYYGISINPVIFFFKQQVFIAHPYYYLPYGNYNNIQKITINDLKKIDLSKIEKFYILIGPNATKIYQQLFVNTNQLATKQLNAKQLNINELKLNQYNLSNVNSLSNDYSNYRFIDIKRTKVFNFYIDSKSSYDIFLFSFPSFYQNYKEYLAMLVIDNLLCDNLVGIFYKDLRENKGIIYSLYSFYPNLFLTSYYLIIFSSDSYSNEFKVFYSVRNVLENIDKIENIDTEINQAKNRVINKLYLLFDNPYSLTNSLIYPLLHKNKFISNFYLINNLYYLDNEYIKQIAKKYLSNYYSFRLIRKK